MSKKITINKAVDDCVIERIKFTSQSKEKPGKLEIHFRSGMLYKYKDVLKSSVDILLEKDVFIAHEYNKNIHSCYQVSERIKTDKFHENIAIERKKQISAKNKAASERRREKAKAKKELENA